MNHLNEDRLIQYAFDLLEADARQEAATHLAQCSDCAARLKQLQQKFTALNVLSEEEALSEQLIGKTLDLSKQKPEAAVPGRDTDNVTLSKPSRALSGGFRRTAFVWIASAAAIVVIGLLIFRRPPEKSSIEEPSQGTRIAKAPAVRESVTSLVNSTPQLKSALEKPTDSTVLTLNDQLGRLAATGDSLAHLGIGARIVNSEAIPDTPPFAPASAIELVVLPAPDQTQLTIYNSTDLTLVRDTRKLTLKPGWNWLQFMWNGTQIDPTSLSLRPLEHAEHIDIELLSYPARLKDIGRWLIRSEVEGAVPFEITYFASGLNWRAFYMGTMTEDETMMSLKGYVNVSNHSGQDFVNAQTRLIVGETRLTKSISDLAGRHYPYGPEIEDSSIMLGTDVDIDYNERSPILGDIPVLGRFFSNEDSDFSVGFAGGTSVVLDIKDIEKEGLSEYFLYTIEGTENLPNTWAKRLPSFDVDNIPVKSLYKYDENRYGSETVRFVSFANDAEHDLGETPIPEGSIKIYRTVNEQQNLSYVGGSDFKYIPVNEDVELNLGPARLVTVQPTLMDYKTDNHVADEDGNLFTGYLIENGQRVYNMFGFDEIETWQVKVTNPRDIPIDLEITRDFGMDTWEIEPPKDNMDVMYKKHDKSRARFTLTVPPQTETMFTYTVTKYQGQRAQSYVKKTQEQTQ